MATSARFGSHMNRSDFKMTLLERPKCMLHFGQIFVPIMDLFSRKQLFLDIGFDHITAVQQSDSFQDFFIDRYREHPLLMGQFQHIIELVLADLFLKRAFCNILVALEGTSEIAVFLVHITLDFFHPFLAILCHLGLANRISSQHISNAIGFIFNLIQL